MKCFMTGIGQVSYFNKGCQDGKQTVNDSPLEDRYTGRGSNSDKKNIFASLDKMGR